MNAFGKTSSHIRSLRRCYRCADMRLYQGSSSSGIASASSTNVTHSGKSFAFAGCGWLLTFHLGVIDELQRTGHINDDTVFAGTSGGAIAALVGCSGRSPVAAMESIIALSTDEKFKRDINAGLKAVMSDMMPADILQRCEGRLHIFTTKVWPNPSLAPTAISHFESHTHLMDSVAASSFIPLYSAAFPELFTGIRTKSSDQASVDAENTNGEIILNSREHGMYIDGGVFASMPPIGEVRVSPFSRRFFIPKMLPREYVPGHPHIYIPDHIHSPVQLLPWALLPPDERQLWDLFQYGRLAAKRWRSDEIQAVQFQSDGRTAHFLQQS